MTAYQCQRQMCVTCHTERDKFDWFGHHGADTCQLCIFKQRRRAEKAEKTRERGRDKKRLQRAAHEDSLRKSRESLNRTLEIIQSGPEDDSELPWDSDDDPDY